MLVNELDERSREIFRQIVETYLKTGEPVGSRLLSQKLDLSLSPASIRNVMADLEEAGLLFAPHTSAGRLPTDIGLRLFVDGLLEVGDISDEERQNIDTKCRTAGRRPEDVLSEAISALSGLSHCAGMVMVPKADEPLKHIEFVNLSPGRALVVVVGEDGSVENRVIAVPLGMPPSTLIQASNYLNSRLAGKTLDEARVLIRHEMDQHRAELDALTAEVIKAGLATWSGDGDARKDSLIVRGHGNLLGNLSAVEDLERIRRLFADLETKKDLVKLLELARDGDGVKIFIGAENKLFSLSGSSVIVSPYTDGREKILGVIGIIGPTRLNYARIIPMVDYTAKMIGQFL
jgi:heat-inducible transcriptional repressor